MDLVHTYHIECSTSYSMSCLCRLVIVPVTNLLMTGGRKHLTRPVKTLPLNKQMWVIIYILCVSIMFQLLLLYRTRLLSERGKGRNLTLPNLVGSKPNSSTMDL